MNKDTLKENIETDVDKMRGAMLEIMSNNRTINNNLIEQMNDSDFSLLEEYGLLTKSILDAAKVLTDIHSQTPKILKDIDNVKEKKPSINLDELMND